MKDKAAIIGVIIVAVLLGVALVVVNNNANQQQKASEARIGALSNDLVSTRDNLQEQQQVNLALSSNLSTTTATYSNKLSDAEANLRATQANLDKTQADAKAAAEAAAAEIAERDKKIADLEKQNTDLDKQSLDLHAAITNLEEQITVTKNKLATSEGDREFLLKEIKRLQAEKADLEKKFNDLAVLKEQVHKLREELSVARRLDWIRRGLYESFQQKGAERLMHQNELPSTNSANPGLNVEVRQSGSSSIVLPPGTNTVPEAPAPGAK
jgi:chromosome segregation ATPase